MHRFPQLVKMILFFICSVIFFAHPQQAKASTEFDISLKTIYHIHEDGTTQVIHTFTIKNNQPIYSISQYGLKISSIAIHDVEVTQNNKKITPELVTTQNQTSIGVTFADKIVGQDKTQTLVISYQDPNAAIISGKVLEVAVPKLHNFDRYTNYQVELITPASFGSPNRVTPANFTSRSSPQQVVTTFDKLNGESVVALFGDEQIFEMSLTYHLENPYNGPRLTQIAFPPNTAYQSIYFRSLEPKPKSIDQDIDGNWIGTYLLPADSVTTVTLDAQAHITLEPNLNVPQPLPHKNLLHAQEFWEVNDQHVESIVHSFSTVRDSYEYVVKNLSYNYDRLSTDIARLGGVAALQSPDQALCQEYTDAFITLSRASGFPSRRVTGYAHTENNVLRPLSFVEDVLHAWPEYYSEEKKVWVPIDPTWEHTSGGINYFDQFDLNHIVFAINGTNSQQPYPAGSYKLEKQQSKDVDISFGTTLEQSPLTIEFKPKPFQLYNNLISLPFTHTLMITNATGQAFYNVPINLSTNPEVAKLNSPAIITIETLLPFQHIEVPIRVLNHQFLAPVETDLFIEYAEQKQSIKINTIPKIWNYFFGPEIVITLGVCLLIVALCTWGVLVLKRK